jgi:uncharacterized membrane protein
MDILKLLVCIILSILVDIPYLYINLDLYKKKTLEISGKGYPKNRYYSALIVYIAIALGIIVFVLPKIDTTKTTEIRLRDSLFYGGLFGVVSYAIFDFTNHFIFEKWDIYVSLMDSIWGGLLCFIVSFIMSYY